MYKSIVFLYLISFAMIFVKGVPMAHNAVNHTNNKSSNMNQLDSDDSDLAKMCMKCEAVVQTFHFINDAILGGEGEEEVHKKILAMCDHDDLGLIELICDFLKTDNIFDVIYQGLRDSITTIYQAVATIIDCPTDLNDLRAVCEPPQPTLSY